MRTANVYTKPILREQVTPNREPRSIKGGSWKDPYKDQYVNRAFLTHLDSVHCYIGFRLAAGIKQI